MIRDSDINCVYLAAMLKDRHPDLFTNLQKILKSHLIEVRLLHKVRDIWIKDFAPVQVNTNKLIKFRYEPDYLRNDPDVRTGDEVVKLFRGLGRCHRSDIILDGGNIVASRTKAILTEKIYKDNPGWIRSELRNQLRKLLLVEQLIVIPKEPFDPFGHSDSMLRFIDEETVLVNDYSEVEPVFGEKLIKVLRRNKLAIELIQYRPEIRSSSGIPSAVGCFTNFLRTEKVLVAPVFGMKQDHVALKKLEAVFPELSIVPLNCTDLARDGGIVNCISGTFNISQKKQ